MRIGIIGAGQLGQMLGFAARGLDIECRFIDPSDSPPATAAGPVAKAAFDDAAALADLARDCDVVTYEFENVPVDALLQIAGDVAVYPPPAALRQSQDRLDEKRLFDRLQIPLPQYLAVDSPADLERAAGSVGLPLVLKTRRFGYDGKGQFVVRTKDEFEPAWQELGGRALIAEEWIPFDYEVSAIGARGIDGEVAIYPLTHNEHDDGILRQSRAPVEDPDLARKAATYLQRLLADLDYVGVLALELFVAGDNLLANEFAPRVHNSGHWTIEGTETSQFANHLLAVAGHAPEPAECRGHAGMLNLIGEIPAGAGKLTGDRCWLHDYGKSPRPGRKLGHMTVIADSAAERDARLLALRRALNKV